MSARDWTATERANNKARCIQMFDRGASVTLIAQTIGCTRGAATNLIKEAQAEQAAPYAMEIARSISHRRMIQRTAWTMFQNEPASTLDKEFRDPDTGELVRIFIPVNVAIKLGILNTISREQDAIDRVTGAAKTDPKETDPARVELDITVHGSDGDTAESAEQRKQREYEAFLAELDAERRAADEEDRRHDPRLAVDTDFSQPEATDLPGPPEP